MDRETFVERVMRGDEVKLDEIVKNRAEQELESIRTEAAQRMDDERRQREAAELRESQIVELLALSKEAETILVENAENERRRLEVLRGFAESELDIRGRYHQTYSKFSQIYHRLGGEAYDFRHVSNPLLNELRERGAVLDKLDIQLTQIPLSPLAQQIADERYRGKS